MSLVQQLLLRGLIARFWKTPTSRSWCAGARSCTTASCCRTSFEQDFQDVLLELRQAGYPVRGRLVRAALRVPLPVRSAPSAQRGIQLELRQAIEPWHVLGEEATAGGTARYVDSSVERLQVKVSGLTDGRHVVTCNGRRVPLHPTGANGEFVAGVRYRAWQPPSCLHPTIPVHAPLVFDLVRHLDGPLAGRLHLPRRPPRRPVLRHLPGQRQRGRGPPRRALLRLRPHAGPA